MGTMTIDGRKVEFTDEKNVLTVIRKAGINIPTLCYHSEVSTFGACRLCTEYICLDHAPETVNWYQAHAPLLYFQNGYLLRPDDAPTPEGYTHRF